jgi:hypothetical protein
MASSHTRMSAWASRCPSPLPPLLDILLERVVVAADQLVKEVPFEVLRVHRCTHTHAARTRIASQLARCPSSARDRTPPPPPHRSRADRTQSSPAGRSTASTCTRVAWVARAPAIAGHAPAQAVHVKLVSHAALRCAREAAYPLVPAAAGALARGRHDGRRAQPARFLLLDDVPAPRARLLSPARTAAAASGCAHRVNLMVASARSNSILWNCARGWYPGPATVTRQAPSHPARAAP